jgi:TrkA domain protein
MQLSTPIECIDRAVSTHPQRRSHLLLSVTIRLRKGGGFDVVEIEQTALPGIGTRHVIVAQSGRRVGVVTHRNGRRELIIYEADDPDTAAASLTLTSDEADTLAELLGAPRILQRLAKMHRELEGLVSEQVIITSDSPYVGRTLGDTQARTRTGASIVAVVRAGEVHASPGPDFGFAARDIVVVVGTAEGASGVARILTDG